MFLPVIVLLLVGMVEIAKFTYTYYTLRKTVYSVAGYLSSQQGVNFCSATDPLIAAGVSFGLTGTTDNTAPVLVTGLDPSMITVAAQRATTTPGGTTTLAACDCSQDCDVSQGYPPPDYIVVSLTGYTLTPYLTDTATTHTYTAPDQVLCCTRQPDRTHRSDQIWPPPSVGSLRVTRPTTTRCRLPARLKTPAGNPTRAGS